MKRAQDHGPVGWELWQDGVWPNGSVTRMSGCVLLCWQCSFPGVLLLEGRQRRADMNWLPRTSKKQFIAGVILILLLKCTLLLTSVSPSFIGILSTMM